jgi:hypothetical protein
MEQNLSFRLAKVELTFPTFIGKTIRISIYKNGS